MQIAKNICKPGFSLFELFVIIICREKAKKIELSVNPGTSNIHNRQYCHSIIREFL